MKSMSPKSQGGMSKFASVFNPIVCCGLIIFQAVGLNYILATHGSWMWLIWICPDVLTIAIVIYLMIVTYLARSSISISPYPNMKFHNGSLIWGHVAWTTHGASVGARIICIYWYFPFEFVNKHTHVGSIIEKLIVYVTVSIFHFLVRSISITTDNNAQESEIIFETMINMLDVFDFLNYESDYGFRRGIPKRYSFSLVIFGLVTLLLPSFHLFIYSYCRYGEKPTKRLLVVRIVHHMLSMVVTDGPLLVTRIFFLNEVESTKYLFTMKNIHFLYLHMRGLISNIIDISRHQQHQVFSGNRANQRNIHPVIQDQIERHTKKRLSTYRSRGTVRPTNVAATKS